MTSSEENLFRRALAALQVGQVDEAELAFKQLLDIQPKHVAALNLLGVVSVQRGRFAEAETYLQRAVNENATSDATFYNYGVVLKGLNRLGEALDRFTQALALNSAAAETWNSRGAVFNQLGRYKEAIPDFDKAISLNPNGAAAYCNKGNALAGLELYDQSLTAYDRSLSIDRNLAEAWVGRGNVSIQLKSYDNAASAFEKAIFLKPDSEEACLGRGNVLSEIERYDEALVAYDMALLLNPRFAEAWLGRGNIFSHLKKYDEASNAYDKALSLNPRLTEAWLGRGNVCFDFKRYEAAASAYDEAISLKPDFTNAWVGRGNVFFNLERYEEAYAAYNKANSLKPDNANAWLGRGNVAFSLGRYDEATAAYNRAIALKPDFSEAWLNLGNVFLDLKYYNDAISSYEKALFLKPDSANAWLGRGNVYCERSEFNEASMAYERALTLQPDLAEAWFGRGNLAIKCKQYGDAAVNYQKAFSIDPNLKYLEGIRLHTKLQLCDWKNMDFEVSRLLAKAKSQSLTSLPYDLLSIPSSAADQLQSAKNYSRNQSNFSKLWGTERYSHDRIRVAYVSSDFRDHAVGHLIVGLIELHDSRRFETTAISLGEKQESAVHRRFNNVFEHFFDVHLLDDQSIAGIMRNREIDIVVDLNGYTDGARPGILARRPAPIQVNYLGYPGTMGTSFMDYIVADATIIPKDQWEFYAEKVVWLPDCYQANDNKRPISGRTPTRHECGLPETAFVFCCFNNTFKISPEIFDIWMRLLKATGDSVLWLLGENTTVVANLRREAEKRGVVPERLIFAPRMALPDHLARHRQADLFLDTLPYNAHTTASDALWAGLPVLTCLGSTFAARVAGSLLKAVGLNELVTISLDHYEALALKLAQDLPLLASIKEKLARNRNSCPLFNTGRFTRHIESAYTEMWKRHQNGEPPRAFAVDPIS